MCEHGQNIKNIHCFFQLHIALYVFKDKLKKGIDKLAEQI